MPGQSAVYIPNDQSTPMPAEIGWIVEIDPFAPASTPLKHSALGRFAHEGCWPCKAVAGKPVVFYMGDDSRNEYKIGRAHV